MNDLSNVRLWVKKCKGGEAKGCFCRSDMWVLLGNGRGDSRRGNVEWFRCSLHMNMFLEIQFQSGVKRNGVWNDLRGPEQVDAMDVWFSVSLQMLGEGKKDFVMLSEST